MSGNSHKKHCTMDIRAFFERLEDVNIILLTWRQLAAWPHACARPRASMLSLRLPVRPSLITHPPWRLHIKAALRYL